MQRCTLKMQACTSEPVALLLSEPALATRVDDIDGYEQLHSASTLSLWCQVLLVIWNGSFSG